LIRIGEVNKLVVKDENSSGFVLDHPDDDESIFLPSSQAPQDLYIGDEIDVFVIVDKDGKLLGSTQVPNTIVGEFGFLKVVDTHSFGAFLDWGIQKDLFLPDTEQKERVKLGAKYLVRVCIDMKTEKIYATTKTGKYIKSSEFDIKEGSRVKIVPISKEELGYRCIINKKFIGMIYHNEIYQNIKMGMPLNGVVKKIREDGLVDAALQVQGFKNVVNSKDTIINYLNQHGGKSHLHDKSSPEEIKRILGMSKKTFKSSIGILYKEKLILIKEDGIELVIKD
jgi:predicted RNA-binding protein (virulence factor B family)